jgi:S1-C subfamily serine protease
MSDRAGIWIVSLAVILSLAVLCFTGAASGGDQFSIYLDADAPGYDYQRFDPPSFSYCQSRCGAETACRAFTYNVAKQVCFLKSNGGNWLIRHEGAITGRKIAGNQFSISNNKDAPGHDYDRLDPPSLSFCESRCSEEPKCRAFVFDTAERGCFLKYEGNIQLVRHREAVTGIKSGEGSPATQPQPAPEKEASGSGFAVSNDGLILTNRHVVADCKGITVLGAGSAAVKAVDELNDLALLSINGRTSAATFRMASPSLGESIYAAGFPYAGVLGRGMNFTAGNVSSLSGIENDSRYLQFTAPVQPGNSGGPLVDANGFVIGVVSARLADIEMLKASGSLPQNVNFAIRGDLARSFLRANGVEPLVAEPESSQSASEIANKAKAYTVQVSCQ